MVMPGGESTLAEEPEALAVVAPDSEAAAAIKGRSLRAIAWRRLRQDKVAMGGGVLIIVFALVAIFAGPITSAYGKKPGDRGWSGKLLDPATLMPHGHYGGVSVQHWFGITPSLGYDIFSEAVYGLRTSLIIGLLATVLSLILGLIVGTLAGYFGGFTDSVLSRTMDMFLSFPVLLFAISLLTVFSIVDSFAGLSGTPLRFGVIIFVLGFFGFAYIGRIVRGQVLSIRENDFIAAARSLGASPIRIMAREVLPNLMGPVLVWTTLIIPVNILGEAGLSYLGVGIQPPTVSLGGMLSDAGTYLYIDPAYLFFPGLVIFVLVLAFNLFGDGLRDALDPKSIR